ncbi:MAG: M28 family peptidase [Gemmatimonadetes bacterium]|nr:M28 family peptidase [Gemmatimonadota bacterium]
MPRRIAVWSVLLAACTPAAKDPGVVPPAGLEALESGYLADRIATLGSDRFLGRAPGTAGEDSTVLFLEREFQALGLEPGNPDGSFVQAVPLVGITPDPSSALTFRRGSQSRRLAFKNDVVAWTKHVTDRVAVDKSDVVFVGYGVEAPEFEWDDFKGLDASGKTLVMLVNDPPLADSTQFGGRAMTYYGRWTYKYEQGQRHKAAAVLIVHETEPAGYPFAVVQGKTGEQFDLVTPDKNLTRSPIEGWITLDEAKALFAMAGQDFDAAKAQAATRDFAPIPLGVTASMSIANRLRTVDSRNVVARLQGSDPALKDEVVVYTAHWDHFGIGDPVDGDSIYNGALDNASGTAGLLALAKAFKATNPAPKRSILFLAVTAEEQGLLGSQYYGVAPLYPLAKTLASINLDGLNLAGRTKDVTVIGLGASELDDLIRRAAELQERAIRPDPEPEKGYYYRSDHFNFAKNGVPALYAEGGIEVVGKPADFGIKAREHYVAHDYHKPSDEVKPDWDYAGAVDDLRLMFMVGWWVANGASYPEWRPGNEFKAIRDRQLGRN